MERVIAGETKLCTSQIQLKDGKTYLLAVFEIEKEKNCLKPEVIAEYPIVLKSSNVRLAIGTKEEFFYTDLAMHAALKGLK